MIRIFLDLDGVLVDFDGQMARAHGRRVADVLSPTERQPWDYHERLGLDFATFWRPAHEPSFWETIPWTDEGRALLAFAERLVGAESVCLLTATTLPAGAAGKITWIQRELPAYARSRFLIGPAKDFVAHRHALLVDDHEVNLRQFRARGGGAVRVPRRWNDDYRYVLRGGDILALTCTRLRRAVAAAARGKGVLEDGAA